MNRPWMHPNCRCVIVPIGVSDVVELGARMMAEKVPGCSYCGRKPPPKVSKMSRQWANSRGFCMCGIPPAPVPLDDEDTVAVYDMLTLWSNPTHDWCQAPACILCRPRRRTV